MDHDQRLKTLLQHFLPDFFALFFPDWAERFDFRTIEWLDTEVFPDPPEGVRRSLDLVAKLHTLQPIADDEGRPAGEWLSLIHIELESADSVKALRRRMHWYYASLRQKHELPVLPIAVYLNVGLNGLGLDEYREHYGPLAVLHFHVFVCGPAAAGCGRIRAAGTTAGRRTGVVDESPQRAARVAERRGPAADRRCRFE